MVEALWREEGREWASAHQDARGPLAHRHYIRFCLSPRRGCDRHALDSWGTTVVSSTGKYTTATDDDIFRQTPCCSRAYTIRSLPGTGPITDAGAVPAGLLDQPAVEKGSYEDAWFSMLEHIVIPAAEEFQPDLVLISAGYDAHRDDEQGGCKLEASSFAEMARHIRGLGERTGAPVGAVLEGGYALDALAASACATMQALAEISRRLRLADFIPAEPLTRRFTGL